jgi:hypothetical protein
LLFKQNFTQRLLQFYIATVLKCSLQWYCITIWVGISCKIKYFVGSDVVGITLWIRWNTCICMIQYLLVIIQKKNVSRCGASNDFVTFGVTVTTLLKFVSIALVVYSFEVMLCIPSESWSCYFEVCMHSDANYFMVFNAWYSLSIITNFERETIVLFHILLCVHIQYHILCYLCP